MLTDAGVSVEASEKPVKQAIYVLTLLTLATLLQDWSIIYACIYLLQRIYVYKYVYMYIYRERERGYI
jgi:hypothetical protein